MKMTRDEFDNLPLDRKIEYLKQSAELWDQIKKDHIIVKVKSSVRRDASCNINRYLDCTSDDWTVVRAVLNNFSYAIDDANAGSGWIHCEWREHPYGYAQLTAGTLNDIVSEYVGTEAYDAVFGEQEQEIFFGLEGLL